MFSIKLSNYIYILLKMVYHRTGGSKGKKKSSIEQMSNRSDSVSSESDERIAECEGSKYNINLVFIGLVLFFLYTRVGTMFPKTEFSKTSLLNGLTEVIPDFKFNKQK